MFSFVHIPSTLGVEPTLLRRSKSGGLEKDELQIYAKDLLKSELDGHARMEAIKEHMYSQGTEVTSLEPGMLKSIMNMGTSLDIITLQVASAANGYIGVSLYCDSNGIAKDMKANTKATSLARSCGHSNIIVYGDAFIGRCYDNEEEPWERRDFSLEELDESSAWVRACASMNAGRNLSSYTTAGSLAQFGMQTQPQATGAITTGSSSASLTNDSSSIGNLQWTQTSDEIEIRIHVDSVVASKDVKIVIKPTHLSVILPVSISSGPSEKNELKLAQPGGAELFSKIISGDSTWTIEGANASRFVVITLAKANAMRWLELLR